MTSPEPALRHESADVNGLRLHYVTAGAGPLIVFAHGFPEFWYAWKRQLAEFGRDHQAVAPDLRGFWGEQDRALLTGNLDGLDRAVVRLTIQRIADGSHWVIHEKPDQVNALIRKFIGG